MNLNNHVEGFRNFIHFPYPPKVFMHMKYGKSLLFGISCSLANVDCYA